MHKNRIYEKLFKRPIDLTVSLIALIIMFPLMVVLVFFVYVFIGRPVVFKQDRPGKNEIVFKMYKLRTMTNKKDVSGILLPDNKRLTRFGKFLRSTSLDELPGLINIIKGDMSIVGPRPLLIQYLPLYSEQQRKRHLVRPGLTGLAQVNGRNSISWNKKFKKDVEYVEQISFVGDMKIILATIKKVFIREGINSKTSETMEYFLGNYDESDKSNE